MRLLIAANHAALHQNHRCMCSNSTAIEDNVLLRPRHRISQSCETKAEACGLILIARVSSSGHVLFRPASVGLLDVKSMARLPVMKPFSLLVWPTVGSVHP